MHLFALLLALPQAPLPQGVELNLEKPVASYTWDRRPPVPIERPAGSAWIPYGEAGTGMGTRYYEPFDPAPGRGATAEGLELEIAGHPVVGRYGAGWQLAEWERYAVGAPPGAVAEGNWTVSFWLQPLGEQEPKESVLRSGEHWRVWRDNEDRLMLRMADGLAMRSPVPVATGSWSHVAVVFQSEAPSAVRLVVNGHGVGRKRTPEDPAARLESVELGGLWCVVDDLQIQARALSSGELAERWEARPAPGEHRLRLALADGTVEERTVWTGVAPGHEIQGEGWDAAERNHVALVEGVARWVPGQWRRDEVDLRPQPRTTQALAYIGGSRLWMYGGETRDCQSGPFENTDDTWIYDIAAQRWERVATGGPAPSPRCHQMAAYSPDHDLVLLPGGWRNDHGHSDYYHDVWVFHVGEGRWEQRKPDFPNPSNMGVVYDPEFKRFLVANYSNFHTYDPAANTWERVIPRGVAREDRGPWTYVPGSSRMVGIDPNTRELILFGGEYGGGEPRNYSNDTVHLDLTTAKITHVQPEGPIPDPRVRAGFAYDSRRGRFVMFGGVLGQSSERKTDLWSYDARTRRWTEHASADQPIGRGGFYGMVYDPELDVFVLPQGRHSHTRFLDEVQRLHLDETAVGRARVVFDLRGVPESARIRAHWKAPGQSKVTWSFASSSDLITWSPPSATPGGVPAARYLRVGAELTPGADGAAPELVRLALEPTEEESDADRGRGVWDLFAR